MCTSVFFLNISSSAWMMTLYHLQYLHKKKSTQELSGCLIQSVLSIIAIAIVLLNLCFTLPSPSWSDSCPSNKKWKPDFTGDVGQTLDIACVHRGTHFVQLLLHLLTKILDTSLTECTCIMSLCTYCAYAIMDGFPPFFQTYSILFIKCSK